MMRHTKLNKRDEPRATAALADLYAFSEHYYIQWHLRFPTQLLDCCTNDLEDLCLSVESGSMKLRACSFMCHTLPLAAEAQQEEAAELSEHYSAREHEAACAVLGRNLQEREAATAASATAAKEVEDIAMAGAVAAASVWDVETQGAY